MFALLAVQFRSHWTHWGTLNRLSLCSKELRHRTFSHLFSRCVARLDGRLGIPPPTIRPFVQYVPRSFLPEWKLDRSSIEPSYIAAFGTHTTSQSRSERASSELNSTSSLHSTPSILQLREQKCPGRLSPTVLGFRISAVCSSQPHISFDRSRQWMGVAFRTR